MKISKKIDACSTIRYCDRHIVQYDLSYGYSVNHAGSSTPQLDVQSSKEAAPPGELIVSRL
jgi:hypothetical protein